MHLVAMLCVTHLLFSGEGGYFGVCTHPDVKHHLVFIPHICSYLLHSMGRIPGVVNIMLLILSMYCT